MRPGTWEESLALRKRAGRQVLGSFRVLRQLSPALVIKQIFLFISLIFFIY